MFQSFFGGLRSFLAAHSSVGPRRAGRRLSRPRWRPPPPPPSGTSPPGPTHAPCCHQRRRQGSRYNSLVKYYCIIYFISIRGKRRGSANLGKKVFLTTSLISNISKKNLIFPSNVRKSREGGGG